MSAFDPFRTLGDNGRPLGTKKTADRFADRLSLARNERRPMKLYRINKLARPGGIVLKKKDVLAYSDREAMSRAKESQDCPICDVLRDGQMVGSIV
jgi:hypothetical protein